MPVPPDAAFPLYDPRFEHDACGVGFVADAGGRHRDAVLPLALEGLASLGHRGAFAADGESSDGAGVSIPLEPSVLRLLAPGVPARGWRAVVALFTPRDVHGSAAARARVETTLTARGLRVAAWRAVPVDPSALGREARASLPGVCQAIVTDGTTARPGRSRRALDRALYLARRTLEIDSGGVAPDDLAVVSASSRTVVYKGLVAGGALGALYPDLRCGLTVSHAVFHQRYATNTSPRWPLAQPFRLIAHNGEINTVRGNREQLRGRAAALGSRFGAEVTALGSLLSAEGSDSLSLDETLDLLVTAGWDLPAALLLALPEALALRDDAHPDVEAFHRRTAGLLAPWDGPAALCFTDGRRVGAMLDRNGLRPAAYAITRDGLVAVASEAGAVPIAATDTVARGRLGPGQLLLVEPRAGRILHDAEAKADVLRPFTRSAAMPRPSYREHHAAIAPTKTGPIARWLCGLDAERLRLDIRTMALDGREPLWSMGDDTPTPALGRLDRRAVDHLRQSFAQVTNPPIDPERERVVMEMGVELGRRSPLLGPLPTRPSTLRLTSPFVADMAGLGATFTRSGAGRTRRRMRVLDATWTAGDGPSDLAASLDRITTEAIAAAESGVSLVVVSDRRVASPSLPARLPIPSVLAVGAVHTALTAAGMRGATDIAADAADILDVHAGAMAVAAGATAVVPWLAVELAGELAGSRGAEAVTRGGAIANVLAALDTGLRKIQARMGISTTASYVGGAFFEVLELDRGVVARCFPTAPTWPGRTDLDELAARQLRRLEVARTMPVGDRLPDPGFARFRGDGEAHLYAPPVVRAVQAVAAAEATPASLDAYRLALARPAAVVRDQLTFRAAPGVSVDEVEPAAAIMRRFVGAAMSLGALSPEAHQTLTVGLRRIGAASNSGEGGEDPAWYVDDGGPRRDASIKQVASARFGVTAAYLGRAEQLEIKIAQGSKPGEGGQLPSAKVTPLIAALRRARPGQSLISPPPHHDIYSIEDLAQLIADLRAINPGARIGVKLVAALGVGTIAAGVAKAGADYVQISGHAGGTGASPLSSIKHAGIPWELGLAEAHQVLMRNGLRDRVAVRTDGGLQTGRDVVIAALLGAEEFGFGTAALVAIGCDMARQCHLDTCPTGIATQRDDLRAKFTGTPDDVVRFFTAIAEDVRRELAALGLRTVGEAVGGASLLRATEETPTLDLSRLLGAPDWPADAARREDPRRSRLEVERQPASALEARMAADYLRLPAVHPDGTVPTIERGDVPVAIPATEARSTVTTAERSFGAHLSGLMERHVVRRPARWRLDGSAGQSFGAFAGEGIELVLVGQANDYVGKGLSGGVVVVRPEEVLRDLASELAVAGNTCLYGATGGRLHVIGRAGIRFAVRNSGADAVVEGVGAHGCEYMTGGAVAILGPTGRNLCAGMTGGRVYLHDPTGGRLAALDRATVTAVRLSTVMVGRGDGAERIGQLRGLLEAHRAAGSALARRLLDRVASLGDEFWLIEPIGAPAPLPEPDAALRSGATPGAGAPAR